MDSGGEESIARVIEIFKGEEEKKEKSAYLCLFSTPPNYIEGKTAEFTWFKFDAATFVDNTNHPQPQTLIHVSRVDDVMIYNNKSFPPDLLLLDDFGCTVWNSKIYIVGGFHRGDFEHFHSQKAFIYDTVSTEWKTSVMNLHRGRKPMVVAADDKIFVFGGSCYKGPDKQVWSEFCDLADGTSKWHYLPDSAPDYLQRHPPQTHAVHQPGKQILFWIDAPGIGNSDYNNLVFSYNYDIKKWSRYENTAPICRGPYWNWKVVVIKDFIFWYHGKTIYAHDLTSDTTRAMCDVTEPTTLDRDPGFVLVHLGKTRLGLFCCAFDSRVWYHTFLLRISHGVGPPALHLVPDCTGYFDACHPFILHALEVPS